MKVIFKKSDKSRISKWISSALSELKDNREYIIEIKRKPNKRSLNANAYAWVLIDKLAEYYKLPPEYIYFKAVREIGGNSFIVNVSHEAEERLVKSWESKGLGWLAEKLDEYAYSSDYRLIYGSSVYDTKQMSQLIDNLVEDCRQADIETLTDSELESLMLLWDKHGGNKE